MVNLNKKYFTFKNKKLIIGIFIYLLFSINCNNYFLETECLFPRTFNLYNGNNILCCDDGIYTYNSNFLKQLYSYKFESKISNRADSIFITISQYSNNGNVIIITKDKFYFLSSEGEVIFKDDLILENSGTYYTLVPFKYENNLNFVVGYINISENLNLEYYYINISSEKIELIKNYSPTVKTYTGITGSKYTFGFACQIMNSRTYNDDILVCFCGHSYPIDIAAFWYYINSGLEFIENSTSFLVFETQTKFIKSVPSPDKSKALICFCDLNGVGYYTIYDINSSNFSNAIKYMNSVGSFASDIYVQYFIRSQEFIFSSHYSKQFKMVKFDKNMNIIEKDNSGSEYDYSLDYNYYGINFYNILLIPEYENYIFFMDGNYRGTTVGRGYLFPDNFKPAQIINIELASKSSIIINPSTIITTIPSIILSTKTNNVPSTTATTILSHTTSTIPSTTPTTIISHTTSTIPSSLINSIKSTIPSTTPTTILSHTTSTIPSTTPTTILSHTTSTIPSSLINSIKSTIPSTTPTTIPSHTTSTIPSSLINSIKSTIPSTIATTILSHTTSTIPSSLFNSIKSTVPPTIAISIPSNKLSTIVSTETTVIQSNNLSTIISTEITAIHSHKISTIPYSLINSIKSTIPSTKTTIIQSHIITTIPSSIINHIKSTLSKIPRSTIFIQTPTSTFPKNTISTKSFTTSQINPKSIIKSSQLFTSKYGTFPFSSLIRKSLTNLPSTSPSTSGLTSFLSSHIPSINSTILTPKILSSTSPKNIENNNVKINEESCSFEYFYKNIITNECEKLCSYNEFINEICYINNLTENNIMNITQNFRKLITKLEVNENTNIVINGNNVVYQVISSEVMDENINKNISIIDFGECEEKLKKVFGIDYILILQIDIFLSTSTNIVMKYEVYNPYTLEKIDLSICNDMTINTYLPYSISDEDLELFIKLQESGYDLYNPNDSFYNDFCTPYTTDNKTDVLLSDRRLDYYKNISFCEEGCTYKSYNYTCKKVQCECQINNEIDTDIDNIKFYSSLFLATFFEIEDFSNIKVLRCFKLVFSKIGQTKNIGSYIFIILNVIYIILIILFCIKGKKQLFNIINTVIRNKTIKMPIKKKNESIKKSKKKSSKNNKNNIIINKNIIIHNHYAKKKNKNKSHSNKSKITESITNNSTKKSQLKLFSPSITKQFLKNEKNLKKQSNKVITFNKNNKSKTKEKNLFIHYYNDFELNSLTYPKAIMYDKRTYTQYYCSLLKQKHLILFTFISDVDYNLLIIKLSLFIFSFSLYFAVNTLFFRDTTIHKLYETQGNIQFIYSILNIIYSTIISLTITLALKLLALSNKSILKLKSYKNRNKALQESSITIKELNIKFYIYIIISFIFLIFFWYFVSAFCAVYNNSQLLLIENTLSSFALSLIYPFGVNLLPGIFRISALRAKNKDRKCLYGFGNLISLI